MKKTAGDRYVICIRSEGAADLQVRKIYRVLPDGAASARGHLRVIDESGEDYLYPAEWFVTVRVPDEAKRALAETPRGGTRRAR